MLSLTGAWDEMGLARGRMKSLVALSVVGPALAVGLATEPIVGQIAYLLAVVVGAASGFTVASLPRHELERSALIQAGEAPALAAAGAVYLQGTGSKSKTILMLKSEEPLLSSALGAMKKGTLLGVDSSETLRGVEDRVQSESVLRVLNSIVRAQGARLQDEGEELESAVKESSSGEETKFPVFLTISFFLPIMLMIFASMEHRVDPVAMVTLAFLEVVVLDLALSLSSTDRRRLSD